MLGSSAWALKWRLAAGVEEPQSVTQRDNADLECGGQVDLKPSFEVEVDHKNTELIKEV